MTKIQKEKKPINNKKQQNKAKNKNKPFIVTWYCF